MNRTALGLLAIGFLAGWCLRSAQNQEVEPDAVRSPDPVPTVPPAFGSGWVLERPCAGQEWTPALAHPSAWLRNAS